MLGSDFDGEWAKAGRRLTAWSARLAFAGMTSLRWEGRVSSELPHPAPGRAGLGIIVTPRPPAWLAAASGPSGSEAFLTSIQRGWKLTEKQKAVLQRLCFWAKVEDNV
jgi:hypothetical protein